MKRGEYPHNLIRFGMQRKRGFLRDFSRLYDGLVIPANILLYQYKTTPLLIYGCKEKPFTVDPMTYLFGYPSFDLFIRRTKEGGSDFKPSFKRLLEAHGLRSEMNLKGRNDVFKYLAPEKRLTDFVRRSVALQTDTLLTNFKKFAAPFLDEDFDEDDYRPNFVISPYFFLTEEANPIAEELMMRIFRECLDLTDEVETEIYAMTFITRKALTDGYGEGLTNTVAEMDIPGYCLWVEDFPEQEATHGEIEALVRIVQMLSDEGRNYVLNMFGGYFAMLLYHFGLGGVSHGTLYSESRAVKDTARRAAGPVLIRYYVPALHQFVTLPNAIRLTRAEPSLLCSCAACSRVVRGDPENIAKFQQQESYAEYHFLLNRANEKMEIGRLSIAELTHRLLAVYDTYASSDWAIGRGKFRDEPIQDLNYLRVWAETLQRLSRT